MTKSIGKYFSAHGMLSTLTTLPPMRKNKEDVEALLTSFLERLEALNKHSFFCGNTKMRRNIPTVD